MELSDALREDIARIISYRCRWMKFVQADDICGQIVKRGNGCEYEMVPAISMVVACEHGYWRKGDLITIPWQEIEQVCSLLITNDPIFDHHLKTGDLWTKDVDRIMEMATNGILKLDCYRP